MSRRRSSRRRQRTTTTIPTRYLLMGLAALVLAVIAGIILAGGIGGNGTPSAESSPVASYAYPVQRFPAQGNRHFAPGTVVCVASEPACTPSPDTAKYDFLNGFKYNSDPPTSGPHASAPAPWGISDEPIPKETLVHNMEHGGVVVWYNCTGGPAPLSATDCGKLRNELAAIVQPEFAAGKHVVMSPYSDMPRRIGLTAWQYLDAFDDFDNQRVQTFLDTFICHYDPENFC